MRRCAMTYDGNRFVCIDKLCVDEGNVGTENCIQLLCHGIIFLLEKKKKS